jgi:hypothetical protein
MIDGALMVETLAKGALLVLYACTKVRAPLGWWWLDTVCVALVVTAMVAWALSGDADVGICITGTAFCISTIPMLANMHRHPQREPLGPWIISFCGACFGVAAIPAWTIKDALTPAIFFVLGLAVVLILVRKKYHLLPNKLVA